MELSVIDNGSLCCNRTEMGNYIMQNQHLFNFHACTFPIYVQLVSEMVSQTKP